MVCSHFDPSPKIWINSIGISIVIGTGLLLSVSSGEIGSRDNWQTFRLYFMPFCILSFSALIKRQEFIVFVSPITETMISDHSRYGGKSKPFKQEFINQLPRRFLNRLSCCVFYKLSSAILATKLRFAVMRVPVFDDLR